MLYVYFIELGTVSHPCENDLVCKCTHHRVPYFNAPVYLENKQPIGKVDEILGSITDFVSLSQLLLWVYIDVYAFQSTWREMLLF